MKLIPRKYNYVLVVDAEALMICNHEIICEEVTEQVNQERH